MTLHLKFTIVKFYKIGHNSDEVDLMDFDFVKEEIAFNTLNPGKNGQSIL